MAVAWSGTDRLSPLEAVPLAIVAVTVLSAILFARRGTPQILRRFIGIYLSLFALAVVFAFAVPDEFGFSFIPAWFLAEPWTILIPPSAQNILLPSSNGNHFGIFPLSALLNSVILFGIGQVSYPKHATTSFRRHPTLRSFSQP